ncbi:hypothetical protein ACQKLP_03105 [Chitinophaga sp. NPDC101104]|uniref:hypothetical protein n=1 Tax=Chitinophaga sp. NPDC101104 TaxID=3390561 RepID=UPI003CFCB48E
MINWKIIACFAIITVMTGACRKNETTPPIKDGNGQPAKPVKRPLGQVTGPAIAKTIGPAGGTLASADHRILLEVPPGTVQTNVQFSIQPVENTLEGSPGKAFRLLPEGVAFTRPVTIRYTPGAEELAGINPEVLFLAYQNKDGYHYLASNTSIDPATHQLSVQTKHFSDWSIVELFELEADTTQVLPGGKAQLQLMWHMGSLLTVDTTDQPIGDLIPYDGHLSKVKWSLASGKGKITPVGGKCSYEAPDEVPAVNPAFVSVSVPITLYDSKRTGLAMLTTPIFTVPDEYVMVSVDGQPLMNLPPNNGESSISMEVDKFYIWAELQQNNFLTILIPGGVTGTGSYPYGEDEKETYIEFVVPGDLDNSWLSYKYDCEDCDQVFSGGHVKITKNGNIGEYVEGEFSVDVWQMGHYAPPKKHLTGKFRVRRTI